MNIQTLTSDWLNSFNEAVSYVENSTKLLPDDYPELSNFKKLCKWLLETECSSDKFTPIGYQNYKSNPFVAQELMSLLHMALLDDGEVSFIKVTEEEEAIRVFMVFSYQHDSGFDEILVEEMMCYGVNKEFKYSIHQDPMRFIEDVEKLELEKSEKRSSNQRIVDEWKNNLSLLTINK